MITLYHGSDIEIKEIDLAQSIINKDFGRGSISVQTILDHCYVHLDIGYKLSQLIGAIVKNDSDSETHIKISDYRCDLNKGFFTSSPNKGVEQLVDEILKMAEWI